MPTRSCRSSFRTLDDQVNRSLNTERMLATLFPAPLAALAPLLSLIGIYFVRGDVPRE